MATGEPSITWPESVDEALCHGWIDGVRKSLGEEAYAIRFTPRRRGGHWSAVNLERVQALLREGRMTPAGLAAYEARDDENSRRYAHEREAPTWPPGFEATFRADPEAWAFFEAQPPGYRRVATYWVTSAKQPATQARRLASLIEDSRAGRRLKQLSRPGAL